MLDGLLSDTVRSSHCVAHNVRKTKEFWTEMDGQ